MLLAESIAERDVSQTWLGENRDHTMRCLVNEARGEALQNATFGRYGLQATLQNALFGKCFSETIL